MSSEKASELLATIREGECGPLYLVAGEVVLAEPAGERLAAALAERAGCEVKVVRRPPTLAPILEDLRTFSLFSTAKVVLAVETALLADKSDAADLVDQAADVLPLSGGEELSGRERQAAGVILQVLHLFGVPPTTHAGSALDQLPEWVLKGGRGPRGRRRTKRSAKRVDELRRGLVELLDLAIEAGMVGWAESDAADLGLVLRDGLPEGHTLVLVESSVATDHPIVRRLAEARRLLEVGEVRAERRGGWSGLEELRRELERQTGRGISSEALDELARRTLRKAEQRGRSDRIDPDSTARFAAEYRKLANLTDEGAETAGPIGADLVRAAVEDRGEEDVWQLLDAIAAGKGGEAQDRLRRLIHSAEDPTATRLSFFSLLADFCRQLVAVHGLMSVQGVAGGERNFRRFKDRLAPRLQASLPEGDSSPVAGLHPFRLHRVYLAASRFSGTDLARLPSRVLDTEMRLKGESGDPDVALAHLVSTLAAGPASRPGPARRSSRRERA